MQSDARSVINTADLGLSATYTPHGTGANSSITAVIEYSSDLGSVPSGQARIATIYVSSSDVGHPAIYDSIEFTDSGETWVVQSIVSGGAGVWQLMCYSERRAGGQ